MKMMMVMMGEIKLSDDTVRERERERERDQFSIKDKTIKIKCSSYSRIQESRLKYANNISSENMV